MSLSKGRKNQPKKQPLAEIYKKRKDDLLKSLNTARTLTRLLGQEKSFLKQIDDLEQRVKKASIRKSNERLFLETEANEVRSILTDLKSQWQQAKHEEQLRLSKVGKQFLLYLLFILPCLILAYILFNLPIPIEKSFLNVMVWISTGMIAIIVSCIILYLYIDNVSLINHSIQFQFQNEETGVRLIKLFYVRVYIFAFLYTMYLIANITRAINSSFVSSVNNYIDITLEIISKIGSSTMGNGISIILTTLSTIITLIATYNGIRGWLKRRKSNMK